MTEGVVVRHALADDYGGLSALFGEVDAMHAEALPWLFRAPPRQTRPPEYYSRLLEAGDSALLVAAVQAHIIGAAIGTMRSAPDFEVFVPQRWGVIEGIVVSSSWRRRGIGSRLVHAAEDWAFGRDAPWVELGVYEFNEAAREFYAALGYEPLMTKMRKPRSDPPRSGRTS